MEDDVSLTVEDQLDIEGLRSDSDSDMGESGEQEQAEFDFMDSESNLYGEEESGESQEQAEEEIEDPSEMAE